MAQVKEINRKGISTNPQLESWVQIETNKLDEWEHFAYISNAFRLITTPVQVLMLLLSLLLLPIHSVFHHNVIIFKFQWIPNEKLNIYAAEMQLDSQQEGGDFKKQIEIK